MLRLFVLSLAFSISECNLGIFSSTSSITGPEEPFHVTCKFTLDGLPDWLRLEKLTLFKRQDGGALFEELISANSVLPNHVEERSFSGGASALVYSDRAKAEDQESFLKALYIQPNSGMAGEYKCEARGVSKSMEILTSQSLVVVDYIPNNDKESVKNRVNELEGKLDAFKADKVTLENRVADLDKQLKKAQSETSNLQKQVIELDQQLEEASARAESIKSQNTNLMNQVTELNEQLNEASASIETVEFENTNLKNRVKELDENLTDATSRAEAASRRLNDLDRRLKEASEREDAAKMDNLDLEQRLKEPENQLKTASEKALQSRTTTERPTATPRPTTKAPGQFEEHYRLTALKTKAYDYVNLVHGMTEISAARSFYVLIKPHVSYDKALEVCYYFKGYFAEINDEDEFDFIRVSLAKIDKNEKVDYTSILTGAKFETKRGYVFFTHPDAYHYFGNWENGKPRQHRRGDWLLLRFYSDFTGKYYLKMAEGPKDGDGQGTLCEISQSYVERIYRVKNRN